MDERAPVGTIGSGTARLDDRIDREAVALAVDLVHAIDGQPGETAALALVLILAELVVISTPQGQDDDAIALVSQQLTLCVARLRAVPPSAVPPPAVPPA